MSHDAHHSNGHSSPDPLAALQQAALEADVAAAEEALAADPQGHALSSNVRAAARAAFAASLSDAHTRAPVEAVPAAGTAPQPSLRVLPSSSRATTPVWSRPTPWFRAAAAVLLVGLTSMALWSGGAEPVEAAGVRLASLQRLDEAATVRAFPAVERGRVATVGEVFAPKDDELLALELSGSSWVVLRGGDSVRVSSERCSASDTVCFSSQMRDSVRRVLGKAGTAIASQDAMLRIDQGEVRVGSTGNVVPLWITNRGLLAVTQGAVHVRVQNTDADPVVSLAGASRAVLFPLHRDTPVVLAREGSVVLGSKDVAPAGPAAASLFRELAFFGGLVPRSTRTIDVPARRWKVTSGAARLRAEGLRFDARKTLGVRWRVPAGLEAARTLRLSLRGPAGMTIRVPALDLTHQIEDASSQAEPGVHVVDLALPAGWVTRLQARPLAIEVSSPDAMADTSRVGWFEAATFVVPAEAAPVADGGQP